MNHMTPRLTPPECNGICLMAWEILEGGQGVAYPHPECDLHSPGWWERVASPEANRP